MSDTKDESPRHAASAGDFCPVGTPQLGFADDDGDGFAAPDLVGVCVSFEGPRTDCDDTDAGVFPGAEEIADDTIDQDCDGVP